MNLKLLRPSNFEEFIGKEQIKNNLKVYIQSAIKNNQQLDHVILYGKPGMGKSSLASIIASEMKSEIKIIQGPSIQRISDIYNFALNIKQGDVIFIDEIHGINPVCFEILYPLMELYCLDISIGKEFNSKITRIKIPEFTLIGATTLLNKIPQPLEDRFGITINLKDYTLEEIFQILKSVSKRVKLKIEEIDLEIIAKNSKGIPRNAIRILNRIIDFINLNENINVKNIIKKLGIYEDGLTTDDIDYLKLFSQKADNYIGIKTISQNLGLSTEFIESRIEPYLLSQNYIEKNFHGRKITDKGVKFINKQIDKGGDD